MCQSISFSPHPAFLSFTWNNKNLLHQDLFQSKTFPQFSVYISGKITNALVNCLPKNGTRQNHSILKFPCLLKRRNSNSIKNVSKSRTTLFSKPTFLDTTHTHPSHPPGLYPLLLSVPDIYEQNFSMKLINKSRVPWLNTILKFFF